MMLLHRSIQTVDTGAIPKVNRGLLKINSFASQSYLKIAPDFMKQCWFEFLISEKPYYVIIIK